MIKNLLRTIGFFACAGLACAQVPHLINYQGRISANGVNFNGTGQFKFALVNGDGSQAYWMNSPDLSPADGVPDSPLALPVSKGLYATALGDTSVPGMAAIPPAVFTNPAVHLRVWFNDGTSGWQKLSPDQKIAAVAYAMVAESVPDGSITTAKLAAGAVTADRLAPGAVTPESIGAETPAGAQAKIDALGASIGGGMNSLKAMLEQGKRDACIHIISDSTNANGYWSNYLAQGLAELYPSHTVKTTNWVAPGVNWSAPVTVQTGTEGVPRRWEFPPGSFYAPIGYAPDFKIPAGDMDIRAKARVDNSTVVSFFCSKWDTPSLRGYSFGQESATNLRKLFVVYSIDGSSLRMISSTAGVDANGITEGTPYWARLTVDLDNGSAGKTFTFYTSANGIVWTVLGTPIVSTGTGTAPFAGNAAPFFVGGQGGQAGLNGAVYAAEMHAGIDGPVTHPLNMDALAFNEGLADLRGAPELWISNAANTGASVDTFLATPDANYCRNYSPQVILISLSHNNPRESGNRFIDKMKTLVSKVRAVYGDIPRIIFLTQNPQLPIPLSYDPNNLHAEARMAHRAQFMSWASGAGYGVIDTWGAFENDPRQIELLVGTNSWSNLPVTALSRDGAVVTVRVDNMSFLSPAGINRVAIIGMKHPDGSPSKYNGAYPITAKSGNASGTGWVQFASTVTDPILPGEGTAGPCDGIHPSDAGYRLWADTILSAFKRGTP